MSTLRQSRNERKRNQAGNRGDGYSSTQSQVRDFLKGYSVKRVKLIDDTCHATRELRAIVNEPTGHHVTANRKRRGTVEDAGARVTLPMQKHISPDESFWSVLIDGRHGVQLWGRFVSWAGAEASARALRAKGLAGVRVKGPKK
jgi:hypothetical protein